MLLGTASFLLSFDSPLVPMVEKYAPKYPMIPWQPFSKSALELELKKGHVVFVDFSAKWCLTCQANKVVFMSHKVVSAFQKNQIVPLHADWTNGDEKITEMLRSLGRNGVPVYAIFRPGEEPLLLPEILTPDVLVQVIESVKSEQQTE
jgi:thiol:disulfide interchange protein DsbD